MIGKRKDRSRESHGAGRLHLLRRLPGKSETTQVPRGHYGYGRWDEGHLRGSMVDHN
jgi:hypothetical protein